MWWSERNTEESDCEEMRDGSEEKKEKVRLWHRKEKAKGRREGRMITKCHWGKQGRNEKYVGGVTGAERRDRNSRRHGWGSRARATRKSDTQTDNDSNDPWVNSSFLLLNIYILVY